MIGLPCKNTRRLFYFWWWWGVESRPVDGGVCKKVLLLPQNGVILVRPIV